MQANDPELKFGLNAVDITDDCNSDFFDRYKYDIPVVHYNGAYWFKHRPPADATLEKQLGRVGLDAEVDPIGAEPDAKRLEK